MNTKEIATSFSPRGLVINSGEGQAKRVVDHLEIKREVRHEEEISAFGLDEGNKDDENKGNCNDCKVKFRVPLHFNF